MNKLTKEQREEALKKVAEVLEQAVAEYEALEKMDLEMAEDPSRPFPAAAAQEAAPSEDEDEDKDKDDDEDEDEESEDEESEEALKSEYAAVVAKMEARGFMKKSEAPAEKTEEVVQKTEEAPAAQPATPVAAQPATTELETLKKSVTDEFEGIKKSIADIAEKVSKIASAPAARKGAAGYAPLKKNEGEEQSQPLNKAETVNKLLDLKKSGDKRVTTDLIMRIETNRFNESDLNQIKGILG